MEALGTRSRRPQQSEVRHAGREDQGAGLQGGCVTPAGSELIRTHGAGGAAQPWGSGLGCGTGSLGYTPDPASGPPTQVTSKRFGCRYTHGGGRQDRAGLFRCTGGAVPRPGLVTFTPELPGGPRGLLSGHRSWRRSFGPGTYGVPHSAPRETDHSRRPPQGHSRVRPSMRLPSDALSRVT